MEKTAKMDESILETFDFVGPNRAGITLNEAKDEANKLAKKFGGQIVQFSIFSSAMEGTVGKERGEGTLMVLIHSVQRKSD